MTAINSEKTIVSLIENNIIHIHFKSNQEIALDDAHAILESMGIVRVHSKSRTF